MIRTLRGLTQKELGVMLGFSEVTADIRIAQYESGARTPKACLLGDIAKALNVSPAALDVPEINSLDDVIHALFALEDVCGIRATVIGNRLGLTLENCVDSHATDLLVPFLALWFQQVKALSDGKITQQEYDDWRFNMRSVDIPHNAES